MCPVAVWIYKVKQLQTEQGFFVMTVRQLLMAVGPDSVRELLWGSKRVFLDLKIHDISYSLAAAAAAAAGRLGVSFVTVHATRSQLV